MRFLRTLRIDLLQILSWKLFAAAGIIGITYVLVGFRFIGESSSIWHIFSLATWGSTSFFTLILIPGFVFSTQITTEWNAHAFSYWIIRSGVIHYTVSKIIACAIAGFLAHFFGMCILALYLIPKLPLYSNVYVDIIYAVDGMNKKNVIWYLIGFITDKSIGAALVSSLGMVISVFFLYPYVAIASPLIVTLTMARLSYIFYLPKFLNPPYWWNISPTAGSAMGAFLDKTIILVIVLTFLCIVGVIGMKRRVSHA